jgi:prepilin-type N-terminal cleavage/methylation domain-containing protein
MMRNRSGFSLIELIIVIFLILLVYSLVFTHYQKEESGPQALSPSNFKEVMLKTIPSGKHATFICTHKCEMCYLRIGKENTFSLYDGKTDLKGSEMYVMDQDERLTLNEYGKFNGDDVCLKIDFYPNRSNTQMVLKSPQSVYFLPAYFGKIQKVSTLDEAQDLWLRNTGLVSDPGDYY